MIEPIDGQPGFFRVCLGGGTYVVDSETGQCGCKAWEFRHGPRHENCKHGEALARYLDKQKECEVCSGQGVLKPRCSYPNMTPLICIACGGSGLKPTDEPLTDSQLKALFA